MKFFVMIYAYRDLELPKTVNNIFAMADNPQNINIGIINADDEDFNFKWNKYKKQVKVKNVNYKEYHGCGRACHEILTELYGGEDYIIKIDPHTRFAKGWDTYYSKFIKPDRVIVSRCLGYDTDGVMDREETAYSKPIGWHNVQVIELQGTQYEGVEKEIFFFNAGFFIAPAAWVKDVGYDPHIAMWGEESDLSCRTFLKGYKMINVPSKVYHLYGRKNRKSVDTSAEFERLNRLGIERAKLKIGLISPKPELMAEWDKYGCDGKLYQDKMNSLFNVIKTEIVAKAADMGYKPDTVVLCNHCGSKTFFKDGKCKWCYKDLIGSAITD